MGIPAMVPTDNDMPIRNLVEPRSSISQKKKLSKNPQRNPATKKEKRKVMTSPEHKTFLKTNLCNLGWREMMKILELFVGQGSNFKLFSICGPPVSTSSPSILPLLWLEAQIPSTPYTKVDGMLYINLLIPCASQLVRHGFTHHKLGLFLKWAVPGLFFYIFVISANT